MRVGDVRLWRGLIFSRVFGWDLCFLISLAWSLGRVFVFLCFGVLVYATG